MSFTSMHNDYLDPDIHNQQQEDYTMDIEEIKAALKAYDTGRWDWDKIDCCITGKYADLEPWGQQGVEIVFVNEDGVQCCARICKTEPGTDVCLNVPEEIEADCDRYDKILETYLEQAYEVVAGCSVAGEWDGDDWYFSDSVDFFVPWVFPEPNVDGVPDYEKTATVIVAGAESVLEPLEQELRLMSKITNVLAGWDDLDGNKCPAGEPSPAAAWRAGLVEEN